MEGAGATPTAVRLPPQMTPFVGRQSELAQLAGLLSDPEIRLVTILGPGGIGKTRLALAAAGTLAPSFANGAAFVPLTPLEEPGDIPSALSASLGIRFYEGSSTRQQLLAYLRKRQMLLVLDNFEHLLDGAALVHEILLASAGIKILATSREKLNLGEEVRFQLGGMSFPQGPELESPPGWPGHSLYGAVTLFLQCARRARPGYEPDEGDLFEIATICRLVEGNPLGIILAAAWMEIFSTREIATEIGRSLDFLETEMRDLPRRHRSIRAVFDSSWGQLAEEEREVFARLAVFRGGFLQSAAECVSGASQRSLIRLVNKSLLLRHPASGRYEIHELLGQYAAERLEAGGQMAATRDRHSAYYAKFMEQRLEDILGMRQLEARDEIAADFENVRTAWSWAAGKRDGPTLDRMAKSIFVYCDIQSRNHEGEALFRQARERLEPAAGEEPQPAWSRVLLPWCDMRTDSLGPPITSQAELGLAAAETAGDRVTMGYCSLLLGKLAADQGEHTQALRLYRRSLEYCPALEDGYFPYARMGHCYLALGRLEEAQGCFERLLDRAVEIGERTAVAWALAQIGEVEFMRGDHAGAVSRWQEAAAAFEEFGASMGFAQAQSLLSLAAFIGGEFGRARELADAVEIFAKEHGFLPQHHREARTVLGWLDILEERYGSAMELLEELVAFDPAKAEAVLGLVFAAAALQLHQEAERCLGVALKPGASYRTPAFEVLQFLAASLTLKHQGNLERAAGLLALTLAHPASPAKFLRQWPLLEKLEASLKEALGVESFAAAWACGEALDPSEALQRLREQFRVSDSETEEQLESRAPPFRPEPMLVEPLSEREMQVLQLLKTDLTGPEIARELFVSLNTVRFHTRNIYGKLGVNNRLAAVHRAAELGL